jgi:hypothetical protein
MRALWMIPMLLAMVAWLGACPGATLATDDDSDVTDDDDDATADDDTADDDDDTTPVDDDDDDDDDTVDDDDTADDDDTSEENIYPPDEATLYLMYGYPSMLESNAVDAYLAIAGGSYNGTYWTWSDGKRSYTIRQYHGPEALIDGVQDPNGIVVYAGHSNFGLGATFTWGDLPGTVTLTTGSDTVTTSEDLSSELSAGDAIRFPSDAATAVDRFEEFTVDAVYASSINVSGNYQGSTCTETAQVPEALENHSHLDYIQGIDDIFNIGSDMVAINYPYLRESQAYPHFELQPEDIVENPVNYTVPYLNIDRFPNHNVPPGATFGTVGTDGYGNPYHYYDTADGYYKTIVHGGAGDLPTDNMHYQMSFIRSCNSGRYYSETFQRGVLFYSTTDDSNYEGALVYIFVRGIIEHYTHDEMLAALNAANPIYEYIDFDAYPTPEPPPGQCR